MLKLLIEVECEVGEEFDIIEEINGYGSASVLAREYVGPQFEIKEPVKFSEWQTKIHTSIRPGKSNE